jgi:DNA repair protein RecO (recombination protein O)
MPDQPRSFRVEAVVLRHANWGEADRILMLYTREQGKLRAVAKGARKIRSRKAGHLEPFTHITLQLAKSRDIPIVTQVETIDPYLPLRETLVLTGYASYVMELLDRFTYEEDGGNLSLFRLLTDTLARLCSTADTWAVVRITKCAFWIFSGSAPIFLSVPIVGPPSSRLTSTFPHPRAASSARNAAMACRGYGMSRWMR